MKSAREEFLGVLCNLYMIFLMGVLPLYHTGTYYMLGDSKYFLFRNVSVICLGVWLVLGIVFELRKKCSLVDICVLCYGIFAVLSAVCSSFPTIAWQGYQDWYMGGISQLMFVGIYFLVSRQYTGEALPIYLGEAAFLVVTLTGLLNRLGVDVFGMYSTHSPKDWEYSHMLSTLGNINWLCGFYSVMTALPMAGYLYSKRRLKQVVLYIVSVLGLTMLCIQGSDSGPVIAVTGIGICVLTCRKQPERFRKVLLLVLGVLILFPGMGRLITLLGTQAATPVDGDIYAKMLWSGWWILAAFVGLVCILLYRVNVRIQKVIAKVLIILGGISVGGVACIVLVKWQGMLPQDWGSGRGALWKLAWDGFLQGDWKQILIGAGPDCFAEYLMSVEISPTIESEWHWKDAIYANAHNEWLTHLINMGVLGVAAYLGIFVSSFKRYKGMLLGWLVLGMYGIHSLVSFQQVLNTPLLFLMLGLCENRRNLFDRKSAAVYNDIECSASDTDGDQ